MQINRTHKLAVKERSTKRMMKKKTFQVLGLEASSTLGYGDSNVSCSDDESSYRETSSRTSSVRMVSAIDYMAKFHDSMEDSDFSSPVQAYNDSGRIPCQQDSD